MICDWLYFSLNKILPWFSCAQDFYNYREAWERGLYCTLLTSLAVTIYYYLGLDNTQMLHF